MTLLGTKLTPEPLKPKPGLASPSSSGAGRVLCGNPTKALQERRHQGQVPLPPQLGPRPGLAVPAL